MRRVRVIIVAVEKQSVLFFSECVFLASVIQEAKRVLPIMLLAVVGPTLNHVPHFINGTIFGNSYWAHIVFLFCL